MINELPIVIVEDEKKLAQLLSDYCIDAGYKTLLFHNGKEAQNWLRSNQPRMLLLDLMLPEVDGLTLCQEFRSKSSAPIMMITARVEEVDRLLGLELGADDYICKPFSPREVIARIKSILRRTERSESPLPDGLVLDSLAYKASCNGKSIELSAVELRLFEIMYQRPGQIFSRNSLMDKIYTDDRIVSDRTIDSHIRKLRNKLEELAVDEEIIQSVYGVGYRYHSV